MVNLAEIVNNIDGIAQHKLGSHHLLGYICMLKLTPNNLTLHHLLILSRSLSFAFDIDAYRRKVTPLW